MCTIGVYICETNKSNMKPDKDINPIIGLLAIGILFYLTSLIEKL